MKMNSEESIREVSKKRLEAAGFKSTQSRLAVLELMHRTNTAISLNQIQSSLKEMDRVTLYRTMKSMQEAGIVHIAKEERKSVFYALCGDTCASGEHDHAHAHFECVQCQSLYCLPIEKSIALKDDSFQVTHQNIQLRGICKNCE